MKKTIAIIGILLISVCSIQAKKKESQKDDSKRPVFSGVLSYYGKVTRIPDKSKTKAKLGDFDSLFKLYMNKNFTRRVESYEGLTIHIVEGINQDLYYQYISTKEGGSTLVVATPQEIQDYQLTPKYTRSSSVTLKEVMGKRRINGYTCRKIICNMVTEDKIRIQLTAWITDELYIPNYSIPYFGAIKGLPLIYDTYNGEHVITYNVTDVDKHTYEDNYFNKPSGIVPMTMTEYLRSMEQRPQE